MRRGSFVRSACVIPRYYDVTLQGGALIILPKEISAKIIGRSVTRTYNGRENAALGYDVEVSDQQYMKYYIAFSGTKEARRTDVGTTVMGLTPEQFSNKSKNYQVTFEVTDGYITIEPRTLKIITRGIARKYNGKPLTFESISILGVASSDKITAKTTGTITDVGKTDNTYEIDWGETNPENYTVTEQIGTLEVRPRDLRVLTGSKIKYYDGKPLTSDRVQLIGLAETDQIKVQTTGSITQVGKTENTCEIEWTGAKPENYNLTLRLGVLEVRESPSKKGTSRKTSTTATLRVVYQTYDKKNKPADRVIKLKKGEEYYVVSPVIPGYQADLEIVEGTIKQNTTVHVEYSKAVYSLQINYADLRNGQLAEPYEEELEYGASYSVESPEIPGYRAVTQVVSGTMGAGNTTVTVLYLNEREQAENETVTDMQGYETPLGLGRYSQQTGICLE